MKRSLENQLLKWKSSKVRFPLILRGARQVGKTYLVEKFGKETFSSFVSVNFEAQPEAFACFGSLDPVEIVARLQSILKARIVPGETLLFLDEIQACPKAILALRYFKEKMGDLHVIAAGSLLEFAIQEGKFSFPVGRIQFLYLHPLSFEEYLLGRGEKLPKCSISDPLSMDEHRKMIQKVREYFLIGGMPAAASTFNETLSFEETGRIHEILLSTYVADFSKYATPAEQNYLKIFFSGIFPLIAQQFKYAKINPHVRSRELKDALNHLEWAGLFKPVYASAASGIRLSAQLKQNRFKLLFLDVGLVQQALQIAPEKVYAKDLIQINRGAIAEQFVGQELIAYSDPHKLEGLFYWQNEKVGSDAEVDYIVTNEEQIIPVEVKAGPTGKLRSLRQFMIMKKAPLGVHISEAILSFKDGVLSVPFYLISKLPEFLEELLSSK